jgi:hypothetical protein
MYSKTQSANYVERDNMSKIKSMRLDIGYSWQRCAIGFEIDKYFFTINFLFFWIVIEY